MTWRYFRVACRLPGWPSSFHLVLHNEQAACMIFGMGILLALVTYLVTWCEDIGKTKSGSFSGNISRCIPFLSPSRRYPTPNAGVGAGP